MLQMCHYQDVHVFLNKTLQEKKAARKKLFYAQQFQFISAVNVKTSIEKKRKIFRNHFSDISEDKLDT